MVDSLWHKQIWTYVPFAETLSANWVFSWAVFFVWREALPLHHVCAFTFQPLTPLKRGWRKGTTVLSEAYQHVFSTLVHALRYLSFPFQLQLDISPTREHKKWVKSSICGQTPFRGDFSCRQSTDLHMCQGVCVWERERLHDWERERWKLFFFYFSPQLVLLLVA